MVHETRPTVQAILFDLDDTLFDSTDLAQRARLEACKAMIDAGLPARSVEQVLARLQQIVSRRGSNYQKHYNELCRSYGVRDDAKLVAAGTIAYHNVKFSQLTLYPKVRELLIRLVKQGYKLALVTRGVPSKQWEKIIRLEISEFSDIVKIVDISRGVKKYSTYLEVARHLEKTHKILPSQIVCVGNNLADDIADANRARFISVRVLQGKHRHEKPKSKLETPKFAIDRVSDLGSV